MCCKRIQRQLQGISEQAGMPSVHSVRDWTIVGDDKCNAREATTPQLKQLPSPGGNSTPPLSPLLPLPPVGWGQ